METRLVGYASWMHPVGMNTQQCHMGREKVCIQQVMTVGPGRVHAHIYDILVKFKEENPCEPGPCKDS